MTLQLNKKEAWIWNYPKWTLSLKKWASDVNFEESVIDILLNSWIKLTNR